MDLNQPWAKTSFRPIPSFFVLFSPLYNFSLSCSALYIQAIFTFPHYFDSSFLWYSMEIVVAVLLLNCVLYSLWRLKTGVSIGFTLFLFVSPYLLPRICKQYYIYIWFDFFQIGLCYSFMVTENVPLTCRQLHKDQSEWDRYTGEKISTIWQLSFYTA